MTYGFAGIGSASHLCSLLFFHAINTTVNLAPYKGTAPALNDLLGGHLDFMCDQTINVLQPAKSGLVKAFAANLQDLDVQGRLAQSGAETVPPERARPEVLRDHLKAELERWVPITRKAGVLAQ
jgi:tripartite-type tricarboxylate transporter receptor subunit TctC